MSNKRKEPAKPVKLETLFQHFGVKFDPNSTWLEERKVIQVDGHKLHPYLQSIVNSGQDMYLTRVHGKPGEPMMMFISGKPRADSVNANRVAVLTKVTAAIETGKLVKEERNGASLRIFGDLSATQRYELVSRSTKYGVSTLKKYVLHAKLIEIAKRNAYYFMKTAKEISELHSHSIYRDLLPKIQELVSPVFLI